MQLRPTFTLRNLLPTDHAGNSKTKAARCQSAAILTKTFSLEAVSLTFKEKREDYLTLTGLDLKFVIYIEPRSDLENSSICIFKS